MNAMSIDQIVSLASVQLKTVRLMKGFGVTVGRLPVNRDFDIFGNVYAM